jgi:hypothetical protein
MEAPRLSYFYFHFFLFPPLPSRSILASFPLNITASQLSNFSSSSLRADAGVASAGNAGEGSSQAEVVSV